MFAIALGQHGAFPSRHQHRLGADRRHVRRILAGDLLSRPATGQMGRDGAHRGAGRRGHTYLVDVALEGTPSRWMIAGFVVAIFAIWLITRPEPSDKKDSSGLPAGVGMAALAGVGSRASISASTRQPVRRCGSPPSAASGRSRPRHRSLLQLARRSLSIALVPRSACWAGFLN